MKFKINLIFSFIATINLMTGCAKKQNKDRNQEEVGHHEQAPDAVHFSITQFNALEMLVDSLLLKNVSSVVHANGQLEVPPQNEAIVTAIIGANVSSINVIEGEEVRKGQVIDYLSLPNLTRIQIHYIKTYNRLQFPEHDYQRQKMLYEEEVGSVKTFQQIQWDYSTAMIVIKSLESLLHQLGINL